MIQKIYKHSLLVFGFYLLACQSEQLSEVSFQSMENNRCETYESVSELGLAWVPIVLKSGKGSQSFLFTRIGKFFADDASAPDPYMPSLIFNCQWSVMPEAKYHGAIDNLLKEMDCVLFSYGSGYELQRDNDAVVVKRNGYPLDRHNFPGVYFLYMPEEIFNFQVTPREYPQTSSLRDDLPEFYSVVIGFLSLSSVLSPVEIYMRVSWVDSNDPLKYNFAEYVITNYSKERLLEESGRNEGDIFDLNL